MFSVYSIDWHRTNNDLKGKHNAFKLHFKTKNNLWSFINQLKVVQSQTLQEKIQLNARRNVNRKPNQ